MPQATLSSLAVLGCLLACVLAPGCGTTPAPAGYYPGLLDGQGAADTGQVGTPGDATATDTALPDTVADGTADAATCSCAGVGCGVPPGCTTSCGGCSDGKVCQANKCVEDPKCLCGETMCGVLPGCAKSCGDCPTAQICEQNQCVPSCVCAGVECGVPAGCTKSCGDCPPGAMCQANECVADPKCTCKAGLCGPVAGCPGLDCGGCQVGQKCEANQCVAGLACECAGVQCGMPQQNCETSCAVCGPGQLCQDNKCKVPPPGKKKFGEACGPNEECIPPPPGAPQTGQNLYQACLDKQCETNECDDGVCTKKCAMPADQVNNVTGANTPDGIADPGTINPCAGAAEGPSGKAFVCVEEASAFQVQQGQSEAMCRPGTQFKPCQASAGCDLGEVCRLYWVLGDVQGRCGPKVHNFSGAAGAKGGTACNLNPESGSVVLCENDYCTGKGCVDLCQTDADCKVAAGACMAGKCAGSEKACAADADCKWHCQAGVLVDPTSPTAFAVCQP